MDVGGVRAWPRASREVLARLFPDGKTIHLPPDGKPLPGYESAMADYKRRMASENIQVASVGGGGGGGRNLFQMLFGGGGDEDESPEAIADNNPPAKAPKSAPAQAPAQVQVASAEPAPQPKQTFIENLPGVAAATNAPVPAVRPALAAPPQPDLETALVSPARNSATAAMASVLQPPQGDGDQQYADLGQYKIPVPELLADRRLPGQADLAAVPLPGARPSLEVAYAGPDVGAQPQPENAMQTAIDNGGDNDQSAREDEIAAMIRRMSPEGAASQPAPANVRPASKPQQVAFAAMPAASAGAQVNRSMKADIRPALSAKGYEPKKGARPSKMDAIAALRGSRSDTPLTGKLIEQWALAANHASATVPKPVDAVARKQDDMVNAKPQTVSTGQPAPSPAQFDPARFYGASPAPARVQ